jgi:hypothetical protein
VTEPRGVADAQREQIRWRGVEELPQDGEGLVELAIRPGGEGSDMLLLALRGCIGVGLCGGESGGDLSVVGRVRCGEQQVSL